MEQMAEGGEPAIHLMHEEIRRPVSARAVVSLEEIEMRRIVTGIYTQTKIRSNVRSIVWIRNKERMLQ